jgi:hypothetical protein
MASSSSSFPSNSPSPDSSTLPKMKRIEKGPLTQVQLSCQRLTKAAAADLLSQHDYLNICKDLSVLFIGDNSIRTLYRDLCKVLSVDHLLDCTEVACANSNYKCIQGIFTIKIEINCILFISIF